MHIHIEEHGAEKWLGVDNVRFKLLLQDFRLQLCGQDFTQGPFLATRSHTLEIDRSCWSYLGHY